MESKIKKRVKEIVYPKVFQHGQEEFVVLFIRSGVGTVVNTGISLIALGKYCESWDMRDFIPFNDVVILENDKGA